jgi:hypothetical protein
LPLLLAIPGLTGCGTSPTNPITSALSGNWQIQAGTTITSPPTGFYIVGAIQTQGSQVTGTFTNQVACSPTVSDYTGSINSAGDLTLDATYDQAKLLAPAAPYTPTTGTLYGGGYLCLAVWGGPAVGLEIPPFNGTYTGTLTSSTSATGTATLKVTQTSSPNANGQFPVSGTLDFTSSSCTSTTNVTGTISGTVVALTSTGTTVSAYDNAGGATLPTTVAFTSGACGATPYAGTLTLR